MGLELVDRQLDLGRLRRPLGVSLLQQHLLDSRLLDEEEVVVLLDRDVVLLGKLLFS